ncbi:MAG TPA: YggT family protein [Alphaproteobacteria bacterium]|nr:YggT family protein [Alphaproteobacteria bacterium]
MDVVLGPLLTILQIALHLYIWVVIAAAIMSWLIAFGVVNTYNRVVYVINDFLYRLTEPALKPFRRFLPNLGGIDISPVVLILVLYFAEMVLGNIRDKLGL